MTLDELRALRPDLSLSVYALQPGGPVTLEILFDDESFTFEAGTLAGCIARAFPPEAPAPAAPEPPPPKPGLFD